MLYALLTSLPWAGVLAYMLYAHREESRERNAALVAEREVWATERRDLLNRVQAPEAAQKQAALEIPQIDPEPAFVPWDDDRAFHEAHQERLTDAVA